MRSRSHVLLPRLLLLAAIVPVTLGARLAAQDLQFKQIKRDYNDYWVWPQKQIIVTTVIQNAATWPPKATPSTFSALFFSRDTTITTADRLVKSFGTKDLAPSETTTLKMSLTIPDDVPGGFFQLGGIVDYTNRVQETSESNNTAFANLEGQVYDLEAITAFSHGDLEFFKGKSMRLTATYKNIGMKPSPVVNAGFYLSADPVVDTSDTFIGTLTLTRLGSKLQVSSGRMFTIPDTNHLPEKAYFGVVLNASALTTEAKDNNTAVFSQRVTTGDFLPKINAKSVSPSSPKWGDQVTLTMDLANKGRRNMPQSRMRLWVQSQAGEVDENRDWLVSDETVPGYSGSPLRYRKTFTLQDLSAGRYWNLRAVWEVPGLDPQTADLPFFLLWPTKPGHYIGQERPYILTDDNAPAFPLSSMQVGSYSNKIYYLFLMGCSGTTPGLTFPGIGTLHLNPDVCTDIGQGLHGTVFSNLFGIQSFNAVGSVGNVRAGRLWKPLSGRTISFAAVYIDLNASPPALSFSDARTLPIKVK